VPPTRRPSTPAQLVPGRTARRLPPSPSRPNVRPIHRPRPTDTPVATTPGNELAPAGQRAVNRQGHVEVIVRRSGARPAARPLPGRKARLITISDRLARTLGRPHDPNRGQEGDLRPLRRPRDRWARVTRVAPGPPHLGTPSCGR
jgi:hypothetical protein